jgi:hypothetical protein
MENQPEEIFHVEISYAAPGDTNFSHIFSGNVTLTK